MAEDITSWISKTIVQHDKENGANYKIPIRGRYVQMIKFSSFRDEFDPHAEIRGVISDKTNWVRVKFDIDATDDFEEPPTPSLQAESLTSHLRSIFLIESFTIQLLPPSTPTRRRSNFSTPNIQNTPVGEIPEIVLTISKWRVVNGDKDDPVYYNDTTEVGKGKLDIDVKVQGVLRKWWFGESNSSQSHQPSTSQITYETPSRILSQNSKPIKSSPLTGYHSSPAIMGASNSSSDPNSNLFSSQNRSFLSPKQGQSSIPRKGKDKIMLLDFLQPYINPQGGNKKKIIPEWLFEKSDEVKEMLSDITMFGLDLGSDDIPDQDEEDVERQGETGIDGTRKGKEKEVAFENEDMVDGSFSQPQREVEVSQGAGKDTPVVTNHSHQPQPSSSLDQSPQRPSRSIRDQTPRSPSPKKMNQNSTSLIQRPIISPHQNEEEESEEEEDILIRPRTTTKTRKEMFDPLAMPSSSPAQVGEDIDMDEEEKGQPDEGKEGTHNRSNVDEEQEGDQDEEDDEDLSDYEKEERRKSKAKNTNRQSVQTSARQNVDKRNNGAAEESSEVEEEMEEAVEPVPQIDSQPQNSYTSDNNDSQNSEIVNSQTSQRLKGEILVDDSDQSLSQHHNSLSQNSHNKQSNPRNQAINQDQDQSIENRASNTQNNQKLEIQTPFKPRVHQNFSLPHPPPTTDQPNNPPNPSHPARISPSYPTSSAIPLSSTKKPKVEQITPAQVQPKVEIPSTQSTVKGSRKSFLQNIRFFPSSNRSSVEPEKTTTKEDEDESPLKNKRKRDSDESLLGRLGKWARGESVSRQPEQEDQGNEKEDKGEVSDDNQQMNDDEEEEQGSEQEEIENDGLDDGLSEREVGDERYEISVEEEEEEMKEEVRSEDGNSTKIDGVEQTDNDRLKAIESNHDNSSDISIEDEDEDEDDEGETSGSKVNSKNNQLEVTDNINDKPNINDKLLHIQSRSNGTQIRSNRNPKSTSPTRKLKSRKLGNDFKLNFNVNGMLEMEIRKSLENIEKDRTKRAGK